MRRIRMIGWLAIVAATGSLGFGMTAHAVPCGGLLTGGVLPATACQNGANGDTGPSVAELNAGGGFFGITGWSLLDSTGDGTNSFVWQFIPGSPGGTNLGLFALFASGLGLRRLRPARRDVCNRRQGTFRLHLRGLPPPRR